MGNNETRGHFGIPNPSCLRIYVRDDGGGETRIMYITPTRLCLSIALGANGASYFLFFPICHIVKVGAGQMPFTTQHRTSHPELWGRSPKLHAGRHCQAQRKTRRARYDG